MASDDEDNGEVKAPQSTLRKVMRYADLIGLSVVMLGLLVPVWMGDGRDQPPKLKVVELDQSFYKTILYPEKTVWDQGGPNGPDVSWVTNNYILFCIKFNCYKTKQKRCMLYFYPIHLIIFFFFFNLLILKKKKGCIFP